LDSSGVLWGPVAACLKQGIADSDSVKRGDFENYAAYSGNFLSTFRDNLSVPSSTVSNLGFFEFLTPEDWTERSRNVCKKLPLLAA
jgi:hypothetical protein